VFAPYASVATNLLFFTKGEPTKEIWYYRVDMPEGYKAFSKTKPIQLKHLDCAKDWWDNRVEIKDKDSDTWKAKKYTIDEIKKLGYNLDLCGYPTEPEDPILSPEETANNFIKRREELEVQLDEKINKILSLMK
jgi:type I restriction enzyme M protein